MANDHRVTVAICTYRRPELADAVQSVQKQVLPVDLALTILVIDNDVDDRARSLVEAMGAGMPWPVVYVHAPAQNVSIARNAALRSTETRWMAFLDDDETAPPDWLSTLWKARGSGEAIFGPSIAVYPDGSPEWARACDFHSSIPQATRDGLETGISGNVLLDLGFVREQGLAFVEELGPTGGEDTIFFMHLRKRGGRLAWVPDAVVHEHPGLSRLTMRWVLRRKYRAGQTYALMRLLRGSKHRGLLVATAAGKSVAAALTSAVLVMSPAKARWWWARSAFHFGVMKGALAAASGTILRVPVPAHETQAGV
ncbi:MAG: glycosyltransferase family 2 protein [Alsobacter sp.]